MTVKKISNPVLTYKSSNFRINFARVRLFVKKTLSHDDFSLFVKLLCLSINSFVLYQSVFLSLSVCLFLSVSLE
jgi:hypothetical protein